jgi:hypothetical protein
LKYHRLQQHTEIHYFNMKSKKKTKVPAYAFGTQFKEIGNNMLENAPDILNTLTTPF